MTEIIRAEAIIRARDETGEAVRSIAQKFEALQQKLRQVGKGAAIAREIDATTAALKRAETQYAQLGKLQGAEARLARWTGLQEEAARRAAAARRAYMAPAAVEDWKAGDAARLQQRMTMAAAVAARVAAAQQRQSEAAAGLRSGLEADGVAVDDLAAAESRLKTDIDSTNAALERNARLRQHAAAAPPSGWRLIGKGNAIAGAIEETKAGLALAEAQLTRLGRLKTAEAKLARLQASYAGAQKAAAAAGIAYAGAERKTAQLEAALTRADDKAARAANSQYRQIDAVAELRSGLESEGVAVDDLAAAESRLRQHIEGTTAALVRQDAQLHAAAGAEARGRRLQHAAGEGGRHLLQQGLGLAGGLGAGYVAAHVVGEGLKKAANEQLAYMYTLLASGMDPTSPAARAETAKLMATAEKASIGTIYSRPDVAQMMPAIAGMADMPIDQTLPFMRGAIQFAEVLKQYGASLGQSFPSEESAKAALQMSHLFGISDPSQMMPILNLIVPAATTASASPAHLVKVFQYMMGVAKASHMSNKEAINLGTLGAILMPGTRSGTGINMLLAGLMPQAGPGAGKKTHRATALRRQELERLGLLDPHTGELYRDAKGGVLMPLLQHLNSLVLADPDAGLRKIFEAAAKQRRLPSQAVLNHYLAAHPNDVYGLFVKLFKQRGARMGYELGRNPKIGQLLQNLERKQEQLDKMGGIPAIQHKMNLALLNQALRARANLDTALTNFLAQTAPALTATLTRLNSWAEGARGFFDKHPEAASIAGKTALGGAGAALAGIGWLTYKLLGAGTALTGAAGALDGSAAALTAAAAKVGAGGIAGPAAAAAGGEAVSAGEAAAAAAVAAKAAGIGAKRWLTTFLSFGLPAYYTATAPAQDFDPDSARNRKLRADENKALLDLFGLKHDPIAAANDWLWQHLPALTMPEASFASPLPIGAAAPPVPIEAAPAQDGAAATLAALRADGFEAAPLPIGAAAPPVPIEAAPAQDGAAATLAALKRMGFGAGLPVRGAAQRLPDVHADLDMGGIGASVRAALQGLKAIVDKPVDVTGRLDPVELTGAAQVKVEVAVTGPGQVTHAFARSQGHIHASVGTSSPDAAVPSPLFPGAF